MDLQQLTAKYGKGAATPVTGVAGLEAKYANGAGLKRWQESQKTTTAPTPTPTAPPVATPTQPNIFQKAKTAVTNLITPKTAPVVSEPINPMAPTNLGVGSNTPQITPEMTATPKQSKVMKETVKFGAKTTLGFADLMTESLDYITDYAAHNLVNKNVPQWKFIADANNKWTKFYDEQSAAGNIPTQKLKNYVDTLQKANFLQDSPEWQKASMKEKLTTKLGETVLNLAPSVLSSAAAFVINPTLGFVVSAASTANDVKDTAVEYGVAPDKAEKLGLVTGLVVGALDKIVPDEVMKGDVKKKFIGSFMKRVLAMSLTTAKETGTEMTQEAVQMLAEKTFRDDLGWDEAKTRTAMAGLGGFLGGAGFSMIGNYSDNTVKKDILGRPEKVETGVNVEEKPIEKKPTEVKPVEKPVEVKKEPIVTPKEEVTPPKVVETTKPTEVVSEQPVKQVETKKEIILAPSRATDEETVIKEAAQAGVLKEGALKKGAYVKPKLGVTEVRTLLTHPEFKANPVMTYNEDGTLSYKGKKVEMTVYPQALNINTEKLSPGDTIRIDTAAFKKAKGIQQTRVYKGDEVLGFNPKVIAEAPESPAAKLEMKKIVRQQDISKMLAEKLGVPLRRGKFRHAGAIGLYKGKQKVSRYKSGGFPTVAHETAGHYLDDMFGFSKNINIEERRKLMAEYGYSYEGQPHKQRKEAFAEFMRFMLTGQNEKAKTYAPKFYEEYTAKIDKMPEVKKVLDEAAHQYKLYQEQPDVAKIISMFSIGKEKEGKTLDRLNAKLHDLYTQTLDDLHPLSEFSKLYKKYVGKDLPGFLDPYILARNLKGWQSKANMFLNKGTFGKTYWAKNSETGKIEMKFKGKSYSDIMKPVEAAGALNEFRAYIAAQRVVYDLAPRGKRSGIEVDVARRALAQLEKSHPEFAKIAEERRQYKNELLDFAAENGLIGQEQLIKIKELNKYHVPFYRVMEEMSSGFMGKKKIAGNMGSPIKTFKGSDRLIIDPLESDIKDTYAIINAAERNNIGIAMANLADKHYELGRLFEKVDAPMKATTINVKEVLDKALEGTGTTTDDIPEDLEDVLVTLFRPTQDRGANMLNVNAGDKKLVYQVDPDLFKAIQGMNAEEVAAWVKLMSIPAKALRMGATLSPDFAVRNPFRDSFSAFIYSKFGFTMGKDFVKGIFEIMKKGSVYDLWVASGGESAMMTSMDRGSLQKSLEETVSNKNYRQRALELAKNPLRPMMAISELMEQATRVGEMKRALESGADPVTAAYASREVTLDFARIGAKMRSINMITAFFNANLQGTDKMVRSFREAPVRTTAKALIGITLPSILLYMANKDDERWKEIPAWQKDLFWIILTPNHVFRIPKPFELGILFGSMPERMLEYMETNDPEVFKQIEKSVMAGFTPSFIPTFGQPLIENLTNYSFFKEQPIVSEGLLNQPKEEQYSRYTSELAKMIGEKLHYSPLKIDNMIQGYTGGLGKYAVSFIDSILIGTGISQKDITPPAKSLEDTPVLKAFMIRPPVGSASESVNKVYEKFEETNSRLTQAKKLLKEGEIEKFDAYVKKYPEMVEAIKLQPIITNFTKLNKAADVIRQSKTLSAEEKRDKLLKIDEFKTEMARTVLDEINKDRTERQKKANPPKTSMKFELVKKAYAAEGLETIKSQKLTDEQNALKRKAGLVKFINGVRDVLKLNPKVTDFAENTLTGTKKQRYETMLKLRDQDFDWYKQNISQADEKVLLGGMDLNTHNLSKDASGKLVLTKDINTGEVKGAAVVTKDETPPQPEMPKVTPTGFTPQTNDEVEPAPTVASPKGTDTPYNDTIKKVFGDKWKEATKVLKRTGTDGIIKGENVQLLSGKEVDIENRIDPKTGMWNNDAPVKTFKNKFSGETENSTDRGLFRINNNRLIGENGLLGGKKERRMMIDAGIIDESYKNYADITPEMAKALWDKMLEPENNIKMAKILYDLNGDWSAWVAAPPQWMSAKRRRELGK